MSTFARPTPSSVAGTIGEINVAQLRHTTIATAIGSMQSAGIKIALPDINKSSFTFTPVELENKIYYGYQWVDEEDINAVV